MASQADPVAEPRLPMSRERVLEAAIALADESGIESLTMRRLAQELGVEAMTLYYYVANKEDILNAIVDMVLSEFELPSSETDWKAAIRKTAISAHDVLVRHPWAASLMLSSTGASAARWRYMNAILGCLREAGFSPDLTDHAYHALDSHITGFTLWEVQIQIDPETLPDLATTFLRELPADEYPYIVEHVQEHLKKRNPDDEGAFAFGLDLILDGLERIRDTPVHIPAIIPPSTATN
jgi:AcrR family transcriptional regulator